MSGRKFTGACPVRQRTADGVPLGRCWYATYDHKCHLHGDVSAPLARFAESRRLTDERELGAPRRPGGHR